MVYNNHNFPVTYQPVQPVPVMTQPNMGYGYNGYQQMQQPAWQQPIQQNNYPQQPSQLQYQQNAIPMQNNQNGNMQNGQMNYSQTNNSQGYQNQNQMQYDDSNNMNSMNNMNNANNANINDQNQTTSTIGAHGVTSTDIIWVNGGQEVENYPIAQGHNGMFMDISEMKMYTKDGSTGLIRDFDLVESQESMQRYHQMKQIENAQFPIVDAYATEIDPSIQKKEIMDDLEEKMNEKFSNLEQKLNELNQFVGIEKENSNVAASSSKRGRSMSKKN